MKNPFCFLVPAGLVAASFFFALPTHAATITRLGQPAGLTVRAAGEHSVRITLQPLAADAPATPAAPLPNPTLVERTWAAPALDLRTLTEPVSKSVGVLQVKVSPEPLTVTVSNAQGQLLQTLNFSDASGNVTFAIGDSPILGLGEGGPTFDRRGRLDPMRPAWGSGTIGSRNPVDLLIGTGGWGLYVAAPWARMDLRGPELGVIIPDDPRAAVPGVFDCFVFNAHVPADLLKNVSVLTGPAVLPPKWALGYMQSHRTLETDAQMVRLVETFREKKLPLDAVIYLGTGFTPVGWNTPQPSIAFNPRVFTRDPKDVLADIHKNDVKVILHVVPPEARDMASLQGNIPARPGEPLDSTHIQTYWEQHVATFNTGVDAWWPDEGDRFNLAERLERQKMYFQGPLLTRPDVRPWSLNRNGHLGSAQWGAWVWSGDTQSQWATLRDQVMVGLNESLSLSPYWGSDTGGFYPTRDLTGELYARWFQFSAFCPSFRSHGRTWHLRLPWGWNTGEPGPDENNRTGLPPVSELHNAEVEPICRDYLNLRYQLMPYTYSLAREAFDTGLPFMRALWIHYPTDPKVAALSNEYLWGRDLLIAPVVERGATARDVYLPAGQWYDWWTNEKIPGNQTLSRAVDLKTMPIYVRAGAIIPFDPVRQFTAEEVSEPTTLRIYPGADGQFLLYDDDGISQAYLKNQGATWTRLTWNDAAQRLSLDSAAPAGVTSPANSVSVASGAPGASSGVARPGVPANLPVPPRTFRIQLLPSGPLKTVTYDGQHAEVAF